MPTKLREFILINVKDSYVEMTDTLDEIKKVLIRKAESEGEDPKRLHLKYKVVPNLPLDFAVRKKETYNFDLFNTSKYFDIFDVKE